MWVTSIAAPVAIAGLGMTCYAILRRQSINDRVSPDYTSYVLNILRSDSKTSGDSGTVSEVEEMESKFLMAIERPCLSANCSSQELNSMVGQEESGGGRRASTTVESQIIQDGSFISCVSSILSMVNLSRRSTALIKKNEPVIPRYLSSSETYLKSNIDVILRREGTYDGFNSALFTTSCITRSVSERSENHRLEALSMTCMQSHPPGTLCPLVKNAIVATRSLVFSDLCSPKQKKRASREESKCGENIDKARLQEDSLDSSFKEIDAGNGQDPAVRPWSEGHLNGPVQSDCSWRLRNRAGREEGSSMEVGPRIVHRVATYPSLTCTGSEYQGCIMTSDPSNSHLPADTLEALTQSLSGVERSSVSSNPGFNEESNGFTSSWSMLDGDGCTSWSDEDQGEMRTKGETSGSSTVEVDGSLMQGEAVLLGPGSIVSTPVETMTLVPIVNFVLKGVNKETGRFKSQGLNEALPLISEKDKLGRSPTLEVIFPPVSSSSRHSDWIEGAKGEGRVDGSRTLILSANCKDLHQFHNFVVQEILKSKSNYVGKKVYRPQSLPDVCRAKEGRVPLVDLPKPVLELWFSLLGSIEERSRTSLIILALLTYVLVYFIMWASETFRNYSWWDGSSNLVVPLTDKCLRSWW